MALVNLVHFAAVMFVTHGPLSRAQERFLSKRPPSIVAAEEASKSGAPIYWGHGSEYCLDVASSTVSSSMPALQIYRCLGNVNQNFIYAVDGDWSRSQIRWSGNPDMCLDVIDGHQTLDAAFHEVKLHWCHSADHPDFKNQKIVLNVDRGGSYLYWTGVEPTQNVVNYGGIVNTQTEHGSKIETVYMGDVDVNDRDATFSASPYSLELSSNGANVSVGSELQDISLQTELGVFNNVFDPNLGSVTVAITDVDNYDWDGDSRPDLNFNGAVIALGEAKVEKEELNNRADGNMFTITLTWENGASWSDRVDQSWCNRAGKGPRTAIKCSGFAGDGPSCNQFCQVSSSAFPPSYIEGADWNSCQVGYYPVKNQADCEAAIEFINWDNMNHDLKKNGAFGTASTSDPGGCFTFTYACGGGSCSNIYFNTNVDNQAIPGHQAPRKLVCGRSPQ